MQAGMEQAPSEPARRANARTKGPAGAGEASLAPAAPRKAPKNSAKKYKHAAGPSTAMVRNILKSLRCFPYDWLDNLNLYIVDSHAVNSLSLGKFACCLVLSDTYPIDTAHVDWL